jgi:hypothetical protein
MLQLIHLQVDEKDGIIIASKDETIAALKQQVTALEKELLSSHGLLTSRGVLERHLQLLFYERRLQGNFNATKAAECLKVSGTGLLAHIFPTKSLLTLAPQARLRIA